MGGFHLNWKARLRLRDFEPEQRFEATCLTCRHIHFITIAQMLRQGVENGFLFVDELEAQSICKARGCRGRVRLAMVRTGDTSGFVGGLA